MLFPKISGHVGIVLLEEGLDQIFSICETVGVKAGRSGQGPRATRAIALSVAQITPYTPLYFLYIGEYFHELALVVAWIISSHGSSGGKIEFRAPIPTNLFP